MNRQARLLGLDKIDVGAGSGPYGLSQMSEGELKERAKALGIQVEEDYRPAASTDPQN
jgi:hypothetical protein